MWAVVAEDYVAMRNMSMEKVATHAVCLGKTRVISWLIAQGYCGKFTGRWSGDRWVDASKAYRYFYNVLGILMDPECFYTEDMMCWEICNGYFTDWIDVRGSEADYYLVRAGLSPSVERLAASVSWCLNTLQLPPPEHMRIVFYMGYRIWKAPLTYIKRLYMNGPVARQWSFPNAVATHKVLWAINQGATDFNIRDEAYVFKLGLRKLDGVTYCLARYGDLESLIPYGGYLGGREVSHLLFRRPREVIKHMLSYIFWQDIDLAVDQEDDIEALMWLIGQGVAVNGRSIYIADSSGLKVLGLIGPAGSDDNEDHWWDDN